LKFLIKNISGLVSSVVRDGSTIFILKKRSKDIIHLVGSGRVLKIEKWHYTYFKIEKNGLNE
jgi:hypothetical protein